jgi:hypothetical protein
MRRSVVVLPIVLGMLALAGSGCPIWIDEHHGGGDAVCIGTFCDCTSHADCDPGFACIGGTCTPTGNCYYTPCADGYVCDTFGTCVPEETVSCTEDVDCELGYCDLASGTCVHTGVCAVDDDCVGYGDSFICDDRGVCTPDRGPCPDGSCGCANDGECTGVGPGGADWLCEAARCVDPAAMCVYDHQCPAGAACVNSFCRVDCSAGASCPSGQVCDGRVCVDDAAGGGLCTYSSECAGGLCVNGYCLLACSVSTECGAFETCQSSMCLPEVNRTADCTAADCAGGLSCVDGVCRMPCAAEVNCAGSDPFLYCWEGFCRTENEIANQCDRQLDCLPGLSCVDGACL